MRFLLDTNVISDTMRATPNRRLLTRLGQHDGSFAISVVSWYEVAYGVRRVPRGARRTALEARLADLRNDLPPPLSFTLDAADWLATERARLEDKGIVPSSEEGQIAATAYVNGLTMVTANTKHFSPFLGLRVVDWTVR